MNNNEQTFASIGYPYLDEMLKAASTISDIEIQYPIADFTVCGILFKIMTTNKDEAIRIYSKYKEEIDSIEKDINRINKTIDGLNNKFCNEQWLTRCPEDILIKEYDKLTYLENELELKHKQIENRLHIRLSFKIKDTNENNRIQCTGIR